MKYKGTENNIYSSDNIDPEFIEYLHKLPAKLLDDLFMAWVMIKNNNLQVPVINIDAIYDKAKPIKDDEIKDFYRYLKLNKVDITKLADK